MLNVRKPALRRVRLLDMLITLLPDEPVFGTKLDSRSKVEADEGLKLQT